MRYELVIIDRLLVEVIHRERPISGSGLGCTILDFLERTLEKYREADRRLGKGTRWI